MENKNLNENLIIPNLKTKDKNLIQLELNNIQKNFQDLKEETLCKIGFILPQIIDTFQHQQIVIPFLKIVHQFIDYSLAHYLNPKELIYQLLENIMLFESIHIQKQAKTLLRRLLEQIEAQDFIRICSQEFHVQQASVLENNLEFLVMGIQEFGGPDLNYAKDLLPYLGSFSFQLLKKIQEPLITCYCELFKYLGSKLLPSLQQQSNYIQNQVFVFMKKWGKKRLQGSRQTTFPNKQSKRNIQTPNKNQLVGKIQQIDIDNFKKLNDLQSKVEYLENLKIDLKNGSYQSGDYSNVLILIKINLSSKSKPILIQTLRCLDLLIKNLGSQFKDTQSLFHLILPIYKWKSDSIKALVNKIIVRISKSTKFVDYSTHLRNYLVKSQTQLKLNILKVILLIFEEKVYSNNTNEFEGLEDTINEMLIEQSSNADEEVRNVSKYIQKYFQKNIQSQLLNFNSTNKQQDEVPKIKRRITTQFDQIQDDEIYEIEEEDEGITDSYVNQRKKTAKDALKILKDESILQKSQRKGMGHSHSTQTFFAPKKQQGQINRHQTQKLLQNISRNSKQSNKGSRSRLNDTVTSNENDTSINLEKKPNQIMSQFLKQTQMKKFDVVQTNQILHNLQKQTQDFMSVQNDKKFKQFLESLTTNDNVEINLQSLVYLRKIICQLILKKKNLQVFSFLQKIILIEGPLELTQYLIQNFQKKGFKEKNFIEIFYKLFRKIPKEFMFIEHTILIYRNLSVIHFQDETSNEFIDYIGHILQPDLHWLEKQYPELAYLEPVEVQEENEQFQFNVNLKKNIEKKLKLISNYEVQDFNQEIQDLLNQSRNQNQKKSILDQMLITLLKYPKIQVSLQNQNKLQKLWAQMAQDLKNNKQMLKTLSQIIYLYFHINIQDQNLMFSQNILADLIQILLKQNSEMARTLFSRALRIHMHNDNEKNLVFYFNQLNTNSSVVQEELIQLIFDKIDNMEEKKIQQLDKAKILPSIFNLIQSKNQTISKIATELMEFLVVFFDQKSVMKIAKNHSSYVEKQLKNFYKQNDQYIDTTFTDEQAEQDEIPLQQQQKFQKNSQKQNKKILEQSFKNAPNTQALKNISQNSKKVEKYIDFSTLKQFDYTALIQNFEIVAENVFKEEIYQLYADIVINKNVINLNSLLEVIEITITSENLFKENVTLLVLVFQLKMLQAYQDMPSIHKIVFELIQLLFLSLNHLNKNFVFSKQEFDTIQTIFHNLNFDDQSYKIMKDQLLLKAITTSLSIEHQLQLAQKIIDSRDIDQNCLMILDLDSETQLSYDLPVAFYFFFGSINQILEILTNQQDEIDDLELYYFSLLYVLARIKVSMKLGLKENVQFTKAIMDELFQLLANKNKVPEILTKIFFQVLLKYNKDPEYKKSVVQNINQFFMLHNMPKEVYFLSKLLFDKKQLQKTYEDYFFLHTQELKIEEIAQNAEQFQKSLIFNAIGEYYYNFNINFINLEKNKQEIQLMDDLMSEWLETLSQLIYNVTLLKSKREF